MMQEPYSSVAPGTWRGVLKLDNPIQQPLVNAKGALEKERMNLETVKSGTLPFGMEFSYDQDDQLMVHILNGDESIASDVEVLKKNPGQSDTVIIKFPHYESEIRAKLSNRVLQGYYIVHNRTNYRIPFVAHFGENHRFTTAATQPKTDITGKWEVSFDVDTDNPYPAIGEFKQNGTRIQGTFRTETGDYRYLAGDIVANKIYLSCFDGSHAFLFEGKLINDDNIIGSFRSGSHYKSTWQGKRNNNAKLPDPNDLTWLKPGYNKFKFEFPNTLGKIISSEDEVFKNKIKLIQISGTWCPNCADETRFLQEYFDKNPSNEVEWVTISFEKHREKEKAMAALNTFKKRFGLSHEVLLGGYYKKSEAAEALPMLNHVLSYPTLIFIDKQNRVRRINTGFNGPATSMYTTFETEFDAFLKTLING